MHFQYSVSAIYIYFAFARKYRETLCLSAPIISRPIYFLALICAPIRHHRSQSRHIWVRRADYTRKKELAILERLTPEQVILPWSFW
jgi:hypothetical protein